MMRVLRFVVLLCATIISNNILAQSQKELGNLMRERDEYYFTLSVNSPADIQAISNLCSVDGTDGRTVVAYANQREYDKLLQAGYQPTLQTPPSLLKEAKMWNGDRATYEWDSYPTYSQYESMMEGFPSSAANDRTCTLITLGTLSSGRKVMGVRINNGNPDGKPKFLYSSTIHGDETTGWILMLRLIDELCTSSEDRIVNLVNNLDIFIFPNTNPDGTYYGGNNTVTGARRYNGNSVDMNRNYPDPHSSEHPDGNAYQTETQWFMQLAEDYPFVMGANYHGGAEVMNYPWDNTSTRHADDAWWQYISNEYVANTRAVYSGYMTDTYSSGITNGSDWYTIGGGRQDYMNGYRQCREITIECSTTKNPSASDLPSFWNYNHNAMLAFMEECLNGVHGFVYDASTNLPLDGVTVTVLNHDDEYSIVSSHEAGDFHRPIKGGSYTFKFTKSGYRSETVEVTVADGQRQDLEVYLTPGSDPITMTCYEQVTPTAAGSYVMGYLNGTTLVMPTHSNSSTVTSTSKTVTVNDNGFSVEEETTLPKVTLTAYGSNGQYYISYNGRYLARSNYGNSLTWGTSQSSYGRWYVNANGIYLTTSGGGDNSTYYLYYNNGSFQLSTTSQNNITFYVEGDCPSSVAAQTCEFTQGCNWWTANVDITLAELEAALGANALFITAQDGSTATYSSYGWGGDLTALEAGKMYKIQMASGCTVTLEGNAIDPSSNTITLYPDNNWIGFMGTQSLSLSAAFVNLTPTQDDKITSQDGYTATYHSVYGWGGELQTLEPGKAYLYNSKATVNKTFTFPSSK